MDRTRLDRFASVSILEMIRMQLGIFHFACSKSESWSGLDAWEGTYFAICWGLRTPSAPTKAPRAGSSKECQHGLDPPPSMLT